MTLSVAPPLSLTVTVWEALVLPRAWLPKLRWLGAMPAMATMPVPERLAPENGALDGMTI